MILSLFTGSIYLAAKRNKLVGLIEEKFTELIDGVELCFILKKDFDGFDLSEKAVGFLNSLKFNTLHAPVKGLKHGKNKKTKTVLRKIHDTGKNINLKQVSFHPNCIKDFSVLAESGLNVCIENLLDGEKRKGWQNHKNVAVCILLGISTPP